jgi:hypothetical protein
MMGHWIDLSMDEGVLDGAFPGATLIAAFGPSPRRGKDTYLDGGLSTGYTVIEVAYQ